MPFPSAIVPSALWYDPEFRSLGHRAQWTYFMLRTQPELNSAGILPLLPGRWARRSADIDDEIVVDALAELSETGWAHVDPDTMDVLVSGIFEAEKIHLQPRRLVAVME